MKIWKFLSPDTILLNIKLESKRQLLEFLGQTAEKMGLTSSGKFLTGGFQARENLMSTGIGNFIALPHTTCSDISNPVLFLLRLASPMDFEALDDNPVDLVFAIVMPEEEINLHLSILAGISRLCRNKDLLMQIRNGDEPAQLLDSIRLWEEQNFN